MKNIIEHAKNLQEDGIGILSVDENALVITFDVTDEEIINNELDGDNKVEASIEYNGGLGYNVLSYKCGKKQELFSVKHYDNEKEVMNFIDVNLYSLTCNEDKVMEILFNDLIGRLMEELQDE